MTAKLISGLEIAARIRAEIKQEVELLKARYNVVPGLATVLVGSDPASVSYITGKEKTAKELGFYSERIDLPENTPQHNVAAVVNRLNHDAKVHGILVQVPLPKQINENEILLLINPGKDVDGFHPVNIGKMVIGEPAYLPCTPAGIQQLLIRSGVETDGAEVVVVGRSNIVGKPIANILLQKSKGANATVTVCHTRTRDLAFHTRRADILIVAAGKPKGITADMVKTGAVVIDVGVNRVGIAKSGKAILVGDVDFESVKEVASMITPVPGGVGPMTITMLMLNTLKAAKMACGI
ncbi:MAG TPA: tetrahydrofolate dehydrogenase/cyclohydrolase catalytic domain-containing protein, partial [Dehalococcoidales bacterium]|nr:tetrahydrofolate dehydrogenase/cyclohydrolase catalytic domain-containing protein [Dehalococcoidales bacterium]